MARDEDDDARPVGRKSLLEAKPLDALSIAELESYIIDLKGEIARVEQAIQAKRSVRAGADSIFGKKSS
jgi:uncharacterized small protein (DUF1192 family)